MRFRRTDHVLVVVVCWFHCGCRKGRFRVVDDVFTAVRHGAFFALVLGIACVDVQSVLAFVGQLNVKGDDEALLVELVLDEFVENVEDGRVRHGRLAGREVVIGVEFAVEFEHLGTFEANGDRQLVGFEDRLEVRERMDVEVTNGFGRAPFAGGACGKGMLQRNGEVHTNRVSARVYHSLEELLAEDSVFTDALEFKTLPEWVRVGLLEMVDESRRRCRAMAYDERGEEFDEVVSILWHVNVERDEIVLHGVKNVAFEFDALAIDGVFGLPVRGRRGAGEAQMEVKGQPVLQRVRHTKFDITGATVVGLNGGMLLIDERKVVVEEERTNERQLFEVLQRHGGLEQLPFGLVGKELQNEVLRVGKKVMFVVLHKSRGSTIG